MKNLFTLFSFLILSAVASAQIAITEISYNPPESGNDSLEYIELYNYTDQAINLENYKFSRGVVFTFPDVSLQPQSYLVVAVNADAMERNFGVNALQWTSDALNNNGEVITLVDADGQVIVSVEYQDTSPWPGFAEGTDGGGRSIELCNPEADPNDGNNWKVSENDLGFEINGRQMYGTPGAANSITECSLEPDHIIFISIGGYFPADITINVGETVRWDSDGTTLINVNGSQDAFPENPESFGIEEFSINNLTYDFQFNIEGFYKYKDDKSNTEGSVTVLRPNEPDLYPFREIAEIKGVNENGVADSLGIRCTIEGVVHTINFRTPGLQFVITDPNNRGFAIFSSTNPYEYDVTPGDKVRLKGVIDQFRGLSQLQVEALEVLSSGNPLVTPKVVTEFEEYDESGYLTIENVSLKDPSEWANNSAGFNVLFTDGTRDFDVRIVNTSEVFSADVPTKLYNITGVLSQFAGSSTPYVGGYQLQPSYLTDFEVITSSDDAIVEKISVFPNPVTNIIKISSKVTPDRIEISDVNGKTMLIGHNTEEVDISSFLPGMYFLYINFSDKTATLKIIKM